jgi:hypothetical protein
MDQCSCRSRNIISGIIICLLLAGIPAALAANETAASLPIGGTITVLSYPPGAAVFLNGEYRSTTPAKLLNVTPGNYLINISLAGFTNESFTTTIFNGSIREYGVNLENSSTASASAVTLPKAGGSGSIAVDSSPGGASVTLDGTAAGKTPAGRAALILNDVPAGSHTLIVELAGYPPYTSTVTVIKNQVVKVDADLATLTTAITGSPVATSGRPEPVPLTPLTAVAAAGLAGLAAVFRRS